MTNTKYRATTVAKPPMTHHRKSGTFLLPSLRGTPRCVHPAPQRLNSRRIAEIIGKPLRKLMVLQPPNKTRVAVGTQDPPNERVFPVFMIDMRRLAGLEALLTDRAFSALVGVDQVIVFRG